MPFKATIKHGQIYCDSLDASVTFRKWCEAHEGAVIYIGTAPEKPRTGSQNNALHLWFEQVAKELNEAGFSVQTLLTTHTKIAIPWTKESVKDILWRTVQVRLLGKSSTTELSKREDIDKVYEVVNLFLGEKLGIHVPFPSMPPDYYQTAPLKSDPS